MSSVYASNQRRVIVAMLVSVALGFVKLFSGLIGNSYALVADAVESLTDLAAAAVIWGGLHVSARPASERHPYGFGKAESLAALIVALLIAAAGVGIAIEALHEIITPHHAPAPFTLGVLLAAIIVKEVLYRFMRRAAAATDSIAVSADAFHHRADVITSALAFIGISVALAGGPGWEPADDWAALIAAAVILYNSFQLMHVPVRELLDVQSDELSDRVRAVAEGVIGVLRVEKVFARKSGPSYWIDMHVWVDPGMNIRDAHALSHEVKDIIRGNFPAVQDVLIHLEPGH